ncbi:MAG: hypothetical protein ACXAC8_07825 [Candidatus Hodarchaeales archaeon]|jgi:hypothetical protein
MRWTNISEKRRDGLVGYVVTISWLAGTILPFFILLDFLYPIGILYFLICFLGAGIINGFLAKKQYFITSVMIIGTIAIIIWMVFYFGVIRNHDPSSFYWGMYMSAAIAFAVMASIASSIILIPTSFIGTKLRLQFEKNKLKKMENP